MVVAAANLEPVFEPVIEQAGFKLVRLRMMGGSSRTLQVMAERPDGSMDVEGCATLSHVLLDFIEAEDPIEGDYEIEVSSPGIDRPLTRLSDFARWSGHEAKIELSDLLDGRKRFRGIIKAVDADTVTITLPDAPKDTDPDHKLPLALLAEAKLVMTDALMNMAQVDQEEFPIDDDADIETVELPSDDPEAVEAEDTAGNTYTEVESADSEQETN